MVPLLLTAQPSELPTKATPHSGAPVGPEFCWVQVAPPFDVTSAMPPLALPPTTQPAEALTKCTASMSSPARAACWVQVAPPLVVARMTLALAVES